MKAPESKAAWRNIDTIYPYELNIKEHDEKQVEKIAASIEQFGWRGNPIVVNDAGVILAGHGRRLAAIKRGMKQVPVEVVSGLTPDEERAYRLADNRVAVSNIDTSMLQRELADLSFDLSSIFDKKELDFMIADMGAINTDAFVTNLDEAITKQAEETVATLAAVAEVEIKIDKALGFKAIKGKDERYVAMFMAQLMGETGKPAAEAFIEFVKHFSPVAKSVVSA
jgi:hypothetical protein